MHKNQLGHLVPIESRYALDFDSIANYIGIPTSTLEEIVKTQPLPLFKLGRHRFALRREIDNWLEAMAIESPYVRRVRQGTYRAYQEAA